MPDPILSLDHDQVKVAPGSQASIKLTVRSTSSRVEGFRLAVIGGAPSRWSEVNPAEVDVYPGEESTATVVFSPPTGTQTLSGTFPFGVRAQATESADDSAVVEGDVHVGQVDGLQAKLIPVTATGRLRGRHVLQLSNQGNTDVELHLSATDPDDLLRVIISPPRVDLAVGAEQSIRLTVRPKKPILLGAPARLPFQLTGEPIVAPAADLTDPYAVPGRLTVDGAMVQRSVFNVPVLIVIAVLVLALGAGGFWIRTHPPDYTVRLNDITNLPAPAPGGVRAKGVASTKIRVSWKPLQQITSYQIVGANGSGDTTVQTVSWTETSADVESTSTIESSTTLLSQHRYCFRVRGMRNDSEGKLSGRVCAKTRKRILETATPTPTPGAAYRYWLLAYRYPKTTASPSPSAGESDPSTPSAGQSSSSPTPDPKMFRSAAEALDSLVHDGFTNAQIVDSETVPDLAILDDDGSTWVPVAEPTWVVAVGQYPDPSGSLAVQCLLLKDKRLVKADRPCVVARAPGA